MSLVRSALATLLLAASPAFALTPPPPAEYYGTLEPFAEHAIYFVLTDRFVNGDPGNDHRDQGGAHPTFDLPVAGAPAGRSANIGYLGGDFKGVLDNADYIRDMGFGAVWITPIVDNPDQAFTGGDPVTRGAKLADYGKTGYHGYWGVNFYRLDEHLPSPGLDFRAFTAGMHAKGLKVVLDIVANHGSPSWGMSERQPGFGQIFDRDGRLLADHGNLPPWQLDPTRQPLQRFYHAWPDLAQLSNNDDTNPAVLDYFAGAYLQWAGQGADAFRIDTISHMRPAFWRDFAARIRAAHPGFFMFGEAFDYAADNIAQYTWNANGRLSLLDFPLRGATAEVFEHPGSDYARLLEALYLTNGPWQNPYEMVTFYDNHDMPRLDASDAGFIDANHWLFTARGIPALYYGSETGFERGHGEHQGNRNYYGQARIDHAAASLIYRQLRRIATLRAASPALQRGLMLPIAFKGDQAAFYRVYQHAGQAEIALVLLNKGDAPADFHIQRWLQPGTWTDAFSGERIDIPANGTLHASVGPHDARIYRQPGPVTRPDLTAELDRLMAEREHPAD